MLCPLPPPRRLHLRLFPLLGAVVGGEVALAQALVTAKIALPAEVIAGFVKQGEDPGLA